MSKCPTCSGPIRETVGMVCQTCGTDYGLVGSAMGPHYDILAYFEYEHLPEHLQPFSKRFHDLAHWMVDMLPVGAEVSAGLRKLLEAKDCAVRAALNKE